MVISINSHGRKSDKETQSPMLKIFKEIMQRENDAVKVNLLKIKHEERKKKLATNSRAQSGHKSSGSEKKYKKSLPYKTFVEQRLEHNPSQDTHTIPFQNEKRDSWWFWGESENLDKKEDTCSRVSCAFRRILSSEYACVSCLLVLFLTSVVLAFLLVFKNIPALNTNEALISSPKLDSDALKRKLEKLKEKRFNTYKFDDDLVGMKDLGDRSEWDDTISKPPDGLSGLADFSNIQDLGTAGFSTNETSSGRFPERLGRDVNTIFSPEIYLNRTLEDRNVKSTRNRRACMKGLMNVDEAKEGDFGDTKLSDDLSNILYSDKGTDEQSSERLKDFYKKLIQTDAQIRNLKKGITKFNHRGSEDNFFFKTSDRAKRSLKRRAPQHTFHFDQKFKRKGEGRDEKIQNKRLDKVVRKKRFSNGTDVPTGFVIEERKVIVEYSPDSFEGKKKVPKCSHVPKESKSHEKQLKHPFYKNTQRLDELLDQFLTKNIPDKVPDPFELDNLFQNTKNSCKHPKIKEKDRKDDVLVSEMDDMKKKKTEDSSVKSELSSDYSKGLLHKERQSGTSTDGYGVVLSISTLLNPNAKKSVSPNDFGDRLPPRKLMQVDEEDDENLGYEDVTEVLTDGADVKDDSDRQGERRKRKDEPFPSHIPNNPFKYSPPGVHNPNWKGPMPLYPDELNSMIKQAAMNANKVQVPHSKDEPSELEVEEKEMNDVEYIEDYFNNKYEKLVKMAQAYSDYGVLDGKKESVTNPNTHSDKAKEKRVELAADSKKLFDSGVLGRWKKASTGTNTVDNTTTLRSQTGLPKREGIRFELRPNSGTREDDPSQVFKLISKHVKISRKDESNPEMSPSSHLTTLFPADLELIYQSTKPDAQNKVSTDRDDDRGVIFKIGRGKRSLQSIDSIEDVEATIEDQLQITSTPMSDTVEQDAKENVADIISSDKRDLFINASEATISSDNNTFKFNNDSSYQANDTKGMSLSDFLMMMSDWFSFLDIIDSSETSNLTKFSSIPTKNVSSRNFSSDIAYPLYDSDMIDNIGHRSRALLAVEDKTDNATDEKTISNHVQTTASNNAARSSPNSTTEMTTLSVYSQTKDSGGNKTVVKRNAVDSSLIFWNEIYDDEEYGVKIDPIENTLNDKHTIKYRDLLRTPRVWLQGKFNLLKDKLGRDKVSGKTARPVRGFGDLGAETQKKTINNKPNRICKRETLSMDDEIDPNRSVDFAHLTANMKTVCRKAARAVQQTRNIEVREDTKEGSVATSLMQQLVRLMTELVDYQVEQKTCLKLPSDLASFLEWLTSPVPEQQLSGTFKSSQHYDDVADMANMDMDEDILAPSSEKEEMRSDIRSECLGTLKAVQELIQDYDVMSDDDKSKMTGVREYLESQMEYLNKQLTADDLGDGGTSIKRFIPFRYKRDLSSRYQKNKRMKRRGKRKFVKNFGKKHTRTTASYYETEQVTEYLSNGKIRPNNKDGNCHNGVALKRNLKDIYYKALADSKKITTLKDMNKN